MITIHYRPEPNFITTDVAERLVADGFEVTAVTAHPNYPYGRFYDSVRSIRPHRSTESGVNIWRLPFFTDHSLSKWRRMVSYMSFALAALIWAPFVCFRPDIVIVYQTPFTSALAALPFKLFFRSKIVLISADLWPESFVASRVAPAGPLLKFLYTYSRWINNRADVLIASTRGMRKRYLGDGYNGRLEYIPLWVDGSSLSAQSNTHLDATLAPYFIYAGNLGAAQGIETLIRAAKILEEKGIHAKLIIYGTGTDEGTLRELADHLKVATVEFRGRAPVQDVVEASRKATAQIVHLSASPLWKMTVPSKLAFCFSNGVPVICAVDGESAELSAESRGALVVRPDSPTDLANAMIKLLGMSSGDRAAMGLNVQKYFENEFSRTQLLNRYSQLFRETVTQHQVPCKPKSE